jgi:hypothetical protein
VELSQLSDVLSHVTSIQKVTINADQKIEQQENLCCLQALALAESHRGRREEGSSGLREKGQSQDNVDGEKTLAIS